MSGSMDDAHMHRISTIDSYDDAIATSRTSSRVALITGLVLVILACAAALLIEAPSFSTAPDCSTIDNAALRLRCYDDIAHQSAASPPARGALAPKID